MISEWLHLDRSHRATERLKTALRDALQSGDAGSELGKIAEQILWANKQNLSAVADQVERILAKAFDIACKNKEQDVAFGILFKEINFFHTFSKYPEFLTLAIKRKMPFLVQALIKAIHHRMSQEVFDKDVIDRISEILLHYGHSQGDILLWGEPILRVVLAEPLFIESLKQMAKWSLMQKHFAKAVEYYQELQAMKKLDLASLEGLCLALIKENRFETALPLFEQALSAGTRHVVLLSLFRDYYLQNGNIEKTKSICLLLDSLQPENIKNKQTIAEIYLAQDKEQEALHYLKQIARHNPSRKDSQIADTLFRKILQRHPCSIDLLQHHLQFLESIGDYRALRKQNLVLGKLYFDNDMHEEALDHFVNLQDFADAQGDLYYQRKILGFIYRIQFKQSQYKSALATLHSLLSVCHRINDQKGVEWFSKEQVKIKRKLEGFVHHALKPKEKRRKPPQSQVITNLRFIADKVLATTPDKGSSLTRNTDIFLNERVDEDIRESLAEAITKRRQGKFEEAKKNFIAIIRQKRFLPLPYFHLFHIFVQEKDLMAAKTTILSALKIHHLTAEEKSRLLLLLAYVHEQCDNPAKAYKAVELAHRMNHRLSLDDRLYHLQQRIERQRLEERVNHFLGPFIKET